MYQANHFGLVGILDIDFDGQHFGRGKGRLNFSGKRIHAAVADVDGADQIDRGAGRCGLPHQEPARFGLCRRGLLGLGHAQKSQQHDEHCMNMAPL